MRKETEAEYYARRERAARDLAARSADPAVSQIHLALADRYAAAATEAAAAASGAMPDRPST